MRTKNPSGAYLSPLEHLCAQRSDAGGYKNCQQIISTGVAFGRASRKKIPAIAGHLLSPTGRAQVDSGNLRLKKTATKDTRVPDL